MYEFLFEPCILRCLNYVWKKNSLRFYDSFLRSEFILYFSCRVKNVFFDNLDCHPTYCTRFLLLPWSVWANFTCSICVSIPLVGVTILPVGCLSCLKIKLFRSFQVIHTATPKITDHFHPSVVIILLDKLLRSHGFKLALKKSSMLCCCSNCLYMLIAVAQSRRIWVVSSTFDWHKWQYGLSDQYLATFRSFVNNELWATSHRKLLILSGPSHFHTILQVGSPNVPWSSLLAWCL